MEVYYEKNTCAIEMLYFYSIHWRECVNPQLSGSRFTSQAVPTLSTLDVVIEHRALHAYKAEIRQGNFLQVPMTKCWAMHTEYAGIHIQTIRFKKHNMDMSQLLDWHGHKQHITDDMKSNPGKVENVWLYRGVAKLFQCQNGNAKSPSIKQFSLQFFVFLPLRSLWY